MIILIRSSFICSKEKSSNNRQRKESFHRNTFSNPQMSCSTNETDDDGYGSLKSSHQVSSRTSSIASDFDEIHDENNRNEFEKFKLKTTRKCSNRFSLFLDHFQFSILF